MIELSAAAELTLSFFLPKWEAVGLEDDPEMAIEIWEYDWNEHYSWVHATRPIEITALADYNIPENALASVEVIELNA